MSLLRSHKARFDRHTIKAATLMTGIPSDLNVHNELEPLPRPLVDQAVGLALEEDLGAAGDITTNAILDQDARVRASLATRMPGRIAGLQFVESAFRNVDPSVSVTLIHQDGADAEAGDTLAVIEGKARSILAAERVALNFLGHLSGIASATRTLVSAVAGHKARICCTRKTTPGLRLFEKYAVRAGGGINHRFGLYDGILIKDNHISIAGGVGPALQAARRHVGDRAKIEIEIDNLDQLDEALAHEIHMVMLDNMSPAQMSEAVRRVNGRGLIEASGGVTADTAAAIAASGVDLISVGWLTHSAPCLDVGLDFD